MPNDKMHEEHYSLLTALCLIIGVCIGSGIYFKADNILIATGGSVWLGVVMFVIASCVIVFGGLSLSVYAERNASAGGVTAYAYEYLPKSLARLFNWEFAMIYLPAISAVLSWVVGVYWCITFGLEGSFIQQIGIGLVFLVLCMGWNMIWPVFAGHFQNATTFIKVLPLIAVGVMGLIVANPLTTLTASAPASAQTSSVAGVGWLMAAAPIAFSFDGWFPATSIAAELKHAKRNMPLALVVSPLIILALYLLYFVGISGILTPQGVMDAGDKSLSLVFVHLWGEQAAVLPNVIALVSIMGTANGIILACMRAPYALALRGEFPASKQVAQVHPTYKFPLVSTLVALGMSLVFMAVHYIAMTANLIPNGDISEISIVFNMLVLALLFGRVIGFWREGSIGIFRGLISPVLGVAGSIFVGFSALTDASRWPFMGCIALVMVACYVWAAIAHPKAAQQER